MRTFTPVLRGFSVANYLARIRPNFGDGAETLAQVYPCKDAKEIRASVIQLLSELAFISESRHIARTHSAAGHKTFRYLFARATNQSLLRNMGAHHGANGSGLTHWPAYRSGSEEMVQFGDDVHVLQHHRNHELDMEKEFQNVGLPLGWSLGSNAAADDIRKPPKGGNLLWKALGLLLTGLALSLGAPFWFDVLKGLGSLRSTGRPPSRAVIQGAETKPASIRSGPR
jgi:hypothetical protein